MAPASGSEWWVISFNPLAGKSTYQYFFGSQSGAEARAKLAVDGSVTGPFASKAAAQSAVAAHKVTPPNTNTAGPLQIGNPLTGINAIGDFFHRLTEGTTWVRVGEAVAGTLLVYVALKAMFPGTVTAIASAAKTAKDTAKIGVLAA